MTAITFLHFVTTLDFYHHFNFSVTFPSSKFACIYQQQQNRLNFAPKSIFASLTESRPCFWREIRFLELSGPLHLTSPALIKQTAREQLLVYKQQSHFISERDPESKKHEWAAWLIHPEPQPISVQRCPLDRLLRWSPLSSNLTRCARWTPDTHMRFRFPDASIGAFVRTLLEKQRSHSTFIIQKLCLSQM